jgi:hypothetical protein
MKHRFSLFFASLILLSVAFAADTPAPKFGEEQLSFYEKEVLPILKDNCLKCHSEKKIRGGLRLDSRSAIFKGGDLGPAVIVGKFNDSPLVKAIHYRDGLEMPPSGKLSADKIETLMKWIRMELPMPADKEGEAKTPAHEKVEVTAKDREWYAYRPLVQPTVPVVKDPTKLANPIDAFILAKLDAKGLQLNSPAEKSALARRLAYDLTGLPLSTERLTAFLADKKTDAYERLVDELLASPGYGEKWGRHWLDLVRYAETNGYERDGAKPYTWRFRDYVIQSFNADKPYDRFVREQLAGDEIAEQNPDHIIATGFYRLGLWDDEPVDLKQARADEVDDWVTTTSQVFLGMTINCARCHDHKKDPIPQTDYYRLASFFQDIRYFSDSRDPRSMTNLTDISPPEERAKYQEELKRREIRRADLKAQMEKLEDEAIKKMPAEDQRASEGIDRPAVVRKVKTFMSDEVFKTYQQLKTERTKLEKLPSPVRAQALSINNCNPRPPVTNVMIRGNPHALGAKVEPGFPVVLNFPDPKIPEAPRTARSSGRRSVLASWLGSKNNPITPRILANRLWQYHFGRGIVASSSDFGKLGETPTHPELLDYLASELLAGDWAMKRIHRLLVTSNTYRQSSKANTEGLAKDPGNSLFWRFNPRRLSAEEVRDTILAVSGNLNRRMAGPSIYPTIPQAVLAGQSRPGEGWGRSSAEEQARRSVYVYIKRSLIVPILGNHDLADTDSSCAVRYTTTVPTQALAMLNGEYTNEQATILADNIAKENKSLDDRIRRVVQVTTGRKATEEEVEKDVKFVRELQEELKLKADAAWRMYCLLALNANEMLYLD